MLWISFRRWDHKGGYFFSWERIYFRRFHWTPFIWGEKRYDSWLEYWRG